MQSIFTIQVGKKQPARFILSTAYFITVPLVPPAVVSMTLVVKLTRRSSWSKPSSSAQYSNDWLDLFFSVHPPEVEMKMKNSLPKMQFKTFSIT